jgi:aryl-alcohol dehydrogenase-like predicted oxidoreductase
MDNFQGPRPLGKCGLKVGRLGVSGVYGAPAEAFEMAFERGCNYFYHGSLRRPGMNRAIKNLVGKGKRDELVIVAQAYTRLAGQLRKSLEGFLRKTGLDHADVLVLGWFNSEPPQRILDVCARLREQGLIRFVAISGHRRSLFPALAGSGPYDIFHIRYNAVHKGAEKDVFPRLPEQGRPGIVTYTSTCWKYLLDTKRMPAGAPTPRGSDCYRFVLSNPDIDVCMTGPKSMNQMLEALAALDRGPLSEEESRWMRSVGDHIYKQHMISFVAHYQNRKRARFTA